MYELTPLTTALKDKGFQVHLETSGAHPLSGNFDWITFSPKQFKAPHQSIYDRASELKVVVAGEYDLKWAEQQAALVPKSTLRYLQPEWNSPNSQSLIFDYILQHPQWRFGLQTHKLLKIQ